MMPPVIPEILGFLVGLTLLVIATYAIAIEPRRLEMTRLDFVIDGLPASFDGFRFFHVTDVHGRSFKGRETRVLAMIRSEEPAPIFFTGDMPIYGADWMPPIDYLRSLQEINQVYLVPGNHDYPRTRRKDIEGTGAIMLLNRAVPLERNGSKIWIAGVDDPDESQPDLDLALRGINGADCIILLAHSPDIYREANGRVDLILCGHTHGGQIRLPGIGALITHTHQTPRNLCMGSHRLSARTQMFVSRGVGTSRWMPARFLCPPEISLIVLHSSPPASLRRGQETAAVQERT